MNSRRRRRWAKAVRRVRAFVAVTLLLQLHAAAQVQPQTPAPAAEGPIVVGKQEKLPPFALSLPHGTLDFLALWASDKSSSTLTGTTDAKDTLYEEAITLETTGHIIHPNFLDLYAKGTFGLTQEDFEGTVQNVNSNSTIYLWDVQANFFREQKLSSLLYTNRSDELVDRSFGSSLRNIYTTYGDLVTIRSQSMPTTLRLYHEDQTQEDLDGNNNFTYNQNVFEWHTDATPTPHQFLTWDYRVSLSESTTEDNFGSISSDSTSQSVSLGHSISFGPEYRWSLGSSVSYSDATGPYGSEQFRLDEILHIKHSSTLDTEYEYLLDKQDFTGAQQQTFQRATADVRHRLYESLNSHGRGGYNQLDYSDGSATKDIFVQSDFTYTKKVPHGRLLGTLFVGYDVRHTDSGSTAFPVIGQPINFNDTLPIFVSGPTIIPSTVVVRSTTNREYIENIDYLVRAVPEGIRLDRLPGGDIDPGQPLLLDYTVGPQPSSDLRTGQFTIGFRYDITSGLLKGFSPYVRYGLVEQSVTGGGGLILPDSIRDYVAGAEYHFWDITLTAEYEDYQSKVIPFDAVRLSGRLDHRFSRDTLLTLYSSYTMLNYSKQGDRTTDILAGISLEHHLTRELYFIASADFIDVDDSAGGHTQGFQELIEIRWRRRQFEVFLRARNANLDGDVTKSEFQYVQVGISREF